MRKSKNLEIDGKKITVYELTVKEIIEITEVKKDGEPLTGSDLNDFKSLLEKNLDRAVSGITLDELVKMAPSDLKTIYDDFKEVNKVFFDVARSVGLSELLNELRLAVQKDFLKLLAGSFPGAT